MSSDRRAYPSALGLILAVSTLSACAGLLGVELDGLRPLDDAGGASIVGADDASVGPGVGDDAKDAAGGDSGHEAWVAGPADGICPSAWTSDNPLDPDCTVRKVKTLEPAPRATALAARIDGTGRIAVVVSSRPSSLSELRFLAFAPPFVPASVTRTVLDDPAQHVGSLAQLTADTVGNLHLVYSRGTRVEYRKILPGAAPGPTILVADGGPRLAAVAIAFRDLDRGYVLYSELPGSVTDVPGTIVKCTCFVTFDCQVAATEITYDPQGPLELVGAWGRGDQENVVYQRRSTATAGTLLMGETPQVSQTHGAFVIDDPLGADGRAGISVQLTATLNPDGYMYPQKQAASFRRAGGQPGTPTLQLRVATWVDTDLRTATLATQVATGRSPLTGLERARVAVALDRAQRLHVAAVLPTADGGGALRYFRQESRDGGMEWVSETIDDKVVTASDPDGHALVAIVIDANDQPHVFYRSGVTKAVRYATRGRP